MKVVEAVEVVARFDLSGKIIPLSVTWREKNYSIESSGRRWQAEDGQHILVMTHSERMFELVFNPTAGRWYLKQVGDGQITA